jgi:endonuclease/exonuclease/phosphatase family metal-dependent hydrolase
VELRVVSWNIRSGASLDGASFWWLRRRSVRDVLVGLRPDVVGLQEVFGFQRRWMLGHTPAPDHWDHCGTARGRWPWGESVPIVWRRSAFERVSSTTRWFGERPLERASKAPGADAPRVATWVELRPSGGGPSFRLVNTHLDAHSAEARRGACHQVVAEMAAADLPTVVLGDFNATLDDDDLAPLSTSGLRSVLPADAGPTATAFEREEGRRLDHVLVSDHWRVRKAEVWAHASTASDHYPVVVDLELL